MSYDADVIVVGAGFAGLAAASELDRLGHDVTVVEGRPRPGGRTWVDQWDDQAIELGGTWIHWFQPHVWTELTRHDIRVVADASPDRCYYLERGELRSRSAEDAWAANEATLSKLFDGVCEALPLPYDPMAEVDAFGALDSISIQSRMESVGLRSEEGELIGGLLRSLAGVPLSKAAFSSMARWWCLAGGTFSTFWSALLGYRIQGGTKSLIDAMLSELTAATRFGFVVKEITSTGDGVEVFSSAGERLTARHVVVTAPVNTWTSIDFQPGLSADHLKASTVGWAAREGSKTIIRVKNLPERIFAQLGEDWPVQTLFTYRDIGGGEQLLVGMSGTPAFDTQDEAQVKAVLASVVPEAEYVASRSHDWTTDEFALGAWPFHQTRQVSNHLDILEAPLGNVSFAGSELARGWSGFIDGAIESGMRSARTIRRQRT